MLWTDSVFVTQDDLARYDSEIAQVADAEGISLTGTNGVLRGAVEEATSEMQKMVISYGGYIGTGEFSNNHMAAVLNVGFGNSVRHKVSLSQVVVSGEVPGQTTWIKNWAVFWALRVFYRDAFGRTVTDRYRQKYDFYRADITRRVLPTIWTLGIPVVTRPLARPAATFERNSGSWNSENVYLVDGSGTLNNTNYRDVAVTYVDMSEPTFYVDSDNRNNCESEPSDKITVQMDEDSVIEVDITSLIPPTGVQHPAQAALVAVSPLKATHWNVYAGVKGGSLYLQNSDPIAINTKTYTFDSDPVLSGADPGIGQYADRRLSFVPTRQRS